MRTDDFTYGEAPRSGVLAPAVSIFADRIEWRDTTADDVLAAGMALRESTSLGALIDGDPRPLGEVVLVDCPEVDARMLTALARLDERAARAGARLIVATGAGALDDVFGCCDRSAPRILVDASRADRVIALGAAVTARPGTGMRLRELSEEDRMLLLRLTDQVDRLARQLDCDSGAGPSGDEYVRLRSPSDDYRAEGDGSGGAGGAGATGKSAGGRSGESGRSGRSGRSVRPPLPDAARVRRIIRQRQARGRFFDPDLFADPAWDILLDLTAARVEQTRVSVTSLCIASGVPPTTALRWIGQMIDAGLLHRVQDDIDRRRAFIALSDDAAAAMARYFAEIDRA